MKILKKLSRKGLDELAIKMPQVNEIQQKECVGGAVFFSEYGSYLGQYGQNTDIQIIDASLVSQTASGIALNAASDCLQLNVINYYIEQSVQDKTYLSGLFLYMGEYSIQVNRSAGYINAYMADWIMNSSGSITELELSSDLEEAISEINHYQIYGN